MRKTKASSCKRSRMKSKIVAFLLVNIWLNLTQFYITRSNLACSDANNDSRFFQFWYSTKPFQIDIDIHTKKTLWKVHVTLNLKQPDHEKPYKFYKTPQNLLRLGCFLVTLPFPTPESFFATLWDRISWSMQPLCHLKV